MTKWKIETYDGSQNMEDFYAEAIKKEFYNNSNTNILFETLNNADNNDTVLHLLYYKERIVGTVVTHNLKELGILGKDAYRIASRTCVLTHLIDDWKPGMKLFSWLTWNHPTAQFLIPACIKTVGRDKPMYISTHNGGIGKQNAVHKLWSKAQIQAGILTDSVELEYKGHIQTFWKFDVERFTEILSEKRWPEAQKVIPI